MSVRLCSAWLLLLASCSDAPGAPGPVGRIAATGAPSLHVPMVWTVTADGPEGTARVEYGIDGFDQRTPEDPVGTHHVVPVLGLKPATRYQWRAVITDDAGEEHVSETGTFETPIPPPEIPRLELAVSEPEATVGYVLASIVNQSPDTSAVGILDRDGQWVWWKTIDPGQIVVTPKLSPDGRSVVWAEYATDLSLDTGYAVRVALDGSERVDTRLPLGHHDFALREDGTIAFVAMTFGIGRGNDGPARIATDQIRLVPEGAPDGAPTELLFDTFADYPHPPDLTCEHMLEPWQRFDLRESFEWTHANSITYVAEQDAYYLNQRFTDWMLKIDGSTGRVLWAMNGLYGDFTLPEGEPPYLSPSRSRLWSHPHWSELWADGGLVFDNGDHATPPRSRALEIAWSEDRREVDIVWEMDHPGGGQAGALGDVRSLPDDHVLITWSALGDVMEVNRAREVLWRVVTPERTSIGRVVPIPDLYTAAGGR